MTFTMPGDLVNEDGQITYLRIDGPEDTRGKARAFFASEWGEDFTRIRVSKRWFAPPAPACDECGEPATCGIAAKWDPGPEFNEKVCATCQKLSIAKEGIFARCEWVKAQTLQEVEPYDGWPVEGAGASTPGAMPYWCGEMK